MKPACTVINNRQAISNRHDRYIIDSDNTSTMKRHTHQTPSISTATNSRPSSSLKQEAIVIVENENVTDKLPCFQPNEKVYAIDSCGETYSATIKKVDYERCTDTQTKQRWKYLVHFNGWNARHDKWMTDGEILPNNEESRRMAEKSRLKAEALEQKCKEKKALLEKEKKRKNEHIQRCFDENGTKKKDKNAIWEVQSKASASLSNYNCCLLPTSLQIVMMDEQLEINRLGRRTVQTGHDSITPDSSPVRKLHDLPNAELSVERVLKQFAKSSIKKKLIKSPDKRMSNVMQYELFATDMIKLFDSMLPKCLLYSFERGQYLGLYRIQKAKDSNIPSMSKVYTCEFLLRMLAHLPCMLSGINSVPNLKTEDCKIEHEVLISWKAKYRSTCDNLLMLISELITFLQSNKDRIFKRRYRIPIENEYTVSERNFADKQTKKCI